MFNGIPMLAKLAMGAGGAGLLAVGTLGATPTLATTTPTPSASPKAGSHHHIDNHQAHPLLKIRLTLGDERLPMGRAILIRRAHQLNGAGERRPDTGTRADQNAPGAGAA